MTASRARPALRGLVVRDMCAAPSNWRSTMSLPDYLRERGVVAIEGVDTRALVRHVRERGAMRAVLSTEDADEASLLAKVRTSGSIVGANLAAGVSCKAPYRFKPADLPESQAFALVPPAQARFSVVAYDCGAKRSILQNPRARRVRSDRGAVGHAGRGRAGKAARRRVPVERPRRS